MYGFCSNFDLLLKAKTKTYPQPQAHPLLEWKWQSKSCKQGMEQKWSKDSKKNREASSIREDSIKEGKSNQWEEPGQTIVVRKPDKNNNGVYLSH